MDILIYKNSSDENVISKSLSLQGTLTGTLKTPFDISSPEVQISNNGPVSGNYCYIPAMNRYYFIVDQTVASNNIVILSLFVDVLKTYESDIKNLSAILDNNTDGDKYLTDNDIFMSTVKTATDVINFPYGFNDDGEFILITAGG